MKGRVLSYLFLILFFNISAEISAQVYRGDLTLTTQTQIDTFKFSEIIGRLVIRESEPGKITNLKGLKSLMKITSVRISSFGFIEGGDLIIDSNSSLLNLEGLENLIAIGRSLAISRNGSLENIDALSNLIRLRWDLIITENPKLENINALKGVVGLAGLVIAKNESLKNIDGLSNVRNIWSSYNYGFSYITENPVLTNIDGLSNLELTNYYFEISNNPALENINGLHNLANSDYLIITNNDLIKNVDGLISLRHLQELTISGNDSLVSLSGLSALESAGEIIISENPDLYQFCELYNVIQKHPAFLTNPSSFQNYSNGANPSAQEIFNEGPCSDGLYVRILNFKQGGEIREGEKILLTWESNLPVLMLEYRWTDSSEWHFITNTLSKQTQFYWVVPNVTTTENILLRYSYTANNEISDTSAPVAIKNVSLAILNPHAGESFEPNSTVNINWSGINAERYRLEYSINEGGSWTVIQQNISDSSFTWVAPDVISDHVQLRLSEQDLREIYTLSDQFSIRSDCEFSSAKMSAAHTEGILIYPSFPTLSYASTKQLSFTVWVKFDSLLNEMPVIDKTMENHRGSNFWIKFSDSQLKFGFSHGAADNQHLTEAGAPVDLRTGKWYHIAAVRDGRLNQLYLKLYLDGILVDSTYTIFRGEDGSDLPMIIGNGIDFFGHYKKSFPGSISEVQMFNKALTHDEIIKRMYVQPDAVKDSIYLVGYWKLNGDAKDYSVYQGDGHVQGNSAWTCDHPFLPYIEPSTAWKIEIKAKVKDLQPEHIYAGIANDAADGYDLLDLPEPPAQPGNYLRVYFPHPEWKNQLARDYMTDIRKNYNFQSSPKPWLFEVQSNIRDTITLTFTEQDFPQDLKKYFSDMSTLARNLTLPLEYKYYNSTSVPKKFTLTISDSELSSYSVPAVELVQPNGGEIWRSNSDKIIIWNVQEGVDTQFIYSVKNDNEPQLIGTVPGDQRQFTWHTPNEYWNNNYRIKIEARDISGHIGEDLSDGTFTVAGDSLAKKSKAGFSLISIPMEVNDHSRTAIIDDDLSGTSYFLYSYLPAAGYRLTDSAYLGRGYWLTLDNEMVWDVSGSLLEADSIMIGLFPGYNLIGNCYARELLKIRDLTFLYDGKQYDYRQAVRNNLITDALLGTAGRYYTNSDRLVPFEGYWIGVLKPDVTMIQHLPLIKKESDQNKIDSSVTVENWQLALTLTSAEISDSDNLFGVKKDATYDFDASYDAAEPPENPEGSKLNLSFIIPENKYKNILGTRFSHEFRAPDDINFDFIVENEKSAELNIIWDNSLIKEIEGLKLLLIDKSNNKITDMLSVNNYSFPYDDPAEFLITGSALTTVENNIPDKYFLSHNYPNPFNPSTRIDFGLPEKAYVSFKIYDITGSEVQKLVDEEKAPGKYTVEWKPGAAASGLYLCRINAGKFTAVRKLIYLK